MTQAEEITYLKEVIQTLLLKVEAITAENSALKAENSELRARLKQNSNNTCTA
jgi:regulator of replication initiation timing